MNPTARAIGVAVTVGAGAILLLRAAVPRLLEGTFGDVLGSFVWLSAVGLGVWLWLRSRHSE